MTPSTLTMAPSLVGLKLPPIAAPVLAEDEGGAAVVEADCELCVTLKAIAAVVEDVVRAVELESELTVLPVMAASEVDLMLVADADAEASAAEQVADTAALIAGQKRSVSLWFSRGMKHKIHLQLRSFCEQLLLNRHCVTESVMACLPDVHWQ